MPFGLTNASAVFQALINDVLRNMLNHFVFVYLDDILIFSRSLNEHVQLVCLVLQHLLENRLYVKAKKCEFHVESVGFLGFVVEKGQLKADPAKIQAVVSWPTPTSRKQLQWFLGVANFYRRFIGNYSGVATPLMKLTSAQTPFVWSSAAEEAFQTLKKRFTTASVLTHPDPSTQFVVEVDASDTGVGAVLSQYSPSDSKIHPCAFFSRCLTPAERNYDVGNRELWCWPCRSGATGWKERPYLLWFGLITKICPTYRRPSGSTLVRLGGPCSWGGSGSHSPTSQGPERLSRTLSPASLLLLRIPLEETLSCCLPAW